ncbi:acyl carrier protein [Actinomycetospora chiangmaiensis]|uniref:acyl carrier protein n=1 Tax=Actinomycetospora chiangmaiensis TaxID=402650 RepID=UPI00037EDAC1|nr:acyl carrier protein [Actinomycetospora chiangmaiensis]
MTADLTTTTEATLREAVRGIVTAELGLAPDALRDDDDLRAVEGADSIKVLRIIARIEQRFDVELEDSDVFGVSTVDGIVGVVTAALPEPT